MNRGDRQLFADALLLVLNEKCLNEYREAVEAVVGDEERARHLEAVGQVGGAIAYMTAHEPQLFRGRLDGFATRFVEHLINQLFIQGLAPSDLLWSGTGEMTDCAEYAAVDLIADDVRRAVAGDDRPKMEDWYGRGFRRGLTVKDPEELKRAEQWQDVAEHVKRILRPLFDKRGSLTRSGRRNF
jgi:hypothetical protein